VNMNKKKHRQSRITWEKVFFALACTTALFVLLQLLGIEGGSVDTGFISGDIVVSDNPISRLAREVKDNLILYGIFFGAVYLFFSKLFQET